MTKDYYNSLLALYNIKENTNSLSTIGTKRPPITTGEPLDIAEHSTPTKLLWVTVKPLDYIPTLATNPST
eukprot:2362291-Amphidinium_carterae.4